ncbi:MAG TPA: GTPase Era [Ignavibacteria bacterium]|nr:GTPase Era [Ignavibacteria bacterium]
MTKCGYVMMFGLPNAGKSTLVNRLLDFNLSVVNRKAQTTRNKILGVLNEGDAQVIFLDTPGYIEKPEYELQTYMVNEIKTSFDEADLVIHIIDITKFSIDVFKKYIEGVKDFLIGKNQIIVINKIDLAEKKDVADAILSLDNEFKGTDIIPVSAYKSENLDELKKIIAENIPEAPKFYDEDYLTNKPEKFFVSEIIRGCVLDRFHKEVPYSVFINIAEFSEREGRKDYINAEIIVERESQKVIIIGKGGASLKKLGSDARKKIERFLERPVYLELFVKVKKDWRKDKSFLKNTYR